MPGLWPGALQEVGRGIVRQGGSGDLRSVSSALASAVRAGGEDWRFELRMARDQAVFAASSGVALGREVGAGSATILPVQGFLLTPKPPFFLQRGGGRLMPKEGAPGEHTVYKVDPKTGEITRYEEFRPQTNPNDPKPWESIKR